MSQIIAWIIIIGFTELFIFIVCAHGENDPTEVAIGFFGFHVIIAVCAALFWAISTLMNG